MKQKDLINKLIVGAKIQIGEEYSKATGGLKAGTIYELVMGDFEYDNGLYNATENAPSIWNEVDEEFDSIYHLFGNDLEDFMDCKIIK